MFKYRLKKIIWLTAISAVVLFFSSPLALQAAGPKVYFFYGDGCPHCGKQEIFFEDLLTQQPDLEIESLEIYKNKENLNLLLEVGKNLPADISGVPFTLVGKNYVSGFSSPQTTGRQIEDYIAYCRAVECEDVVALIRSNSENLPNQQESGQNPSSDAWPEKISLPLFGELTVKNLSLPVLTIAIAALDGFNPCAMWVLIFLIGLLLGLDNWKRRWLLGLVFLVTSATVYFIFMAAWLNFILFLGVVLWVRLAIGILAVGGGLANLKQYWQNPTGACKVTAPTKRKLFFEKLKEYALKQQLWLALLGIIALAFAVNLVELICSAGLPAIYTQILVLSDLPVWQYYAYLLLYVLIFLLDDILVFVIAMTTLQLTGLSTKYSRYSNLIGGLIMLLLGILLIFRPEWLMFG